jgi:heme exporter protein C
MSQKTVDSVLLGLTFPTMLVSLYAIFLYAPVEETMGVSQKIFYIHLPLAWLSFLAFFLVFIASILYLNTRGARWNVVAYCSAEVGVIFCTLVLITGSIWAKPAWNVWWTWDPRLTTLLILWCMYIAYLMLWKLLKPGAQTANITAVFGIISFVNVPITFVAIRMWRTVHPVVIDSGGFHMLSSMRNTLLMSFAAFTIFFVVLLRGRIRLEHSIRRYQELWFLMEKKSRRS